MEREMFDEFLESMKEALAIERGELEPSRVTILEIPNVTQIRKDMKLSRSQFARLLGVSVRTVEGWEQGRRNPQGPARALLIVAKKHPEALLDALAA